MDWVSDTDTPLQAAVKPGPTLTEPPTVYSMC